MNYYIDESKLSVYYTLPALKKKEKLLVSSLYRTKQLCLSHF